MGSNKKFRISFKFQVSSFRKIILFIGVSFILVLFSGLLSGLSASAATIFFGAPGQEIGLGKEFEVGVFLNTEDESINAVEGEIIFPTDLIELKEIREGGSIIALWIERPHVGESGQILFAGVTPGGYIGEKTYLFSIIFQAKQLGQVTISTSNERVLLNDGQGSEAKLRRAPLVLDIKEESLTPPYLAFQDAVPPEPFQPVITQDPNVFDNQWFLVFTTQDKGSGIDHYEIREGKRPFVIAESPYLLQNQNLDEKIIVKAIDKNSNERLSILAPPKPKPWYKNYLIIAIIILGIAIIGYIIWRLLRKFL